MRRASLFALVVLAAAGALLGRAATTPGPRDAGPPIPADVLSAPAEDDAAYTPSAPPAEAEAALPRPRSLRGTRVDGALVVDADGHFLPTLDARRLFDYFLTATGEVPDDALRARIEREIARRLPEEAAREATALLDRYLVYRERVRALATADVPDDDDLDSRLSTLVALRRETLGPDAAEAFFAEEEADARRLLESRRIANDPTLAPEDRTARIEAIFATAEADLPAEVREARAASRVATTLRGAEDEIRARGGDAAEIAALRTRLVGPEAAARLAELDRARADWQGRVEVFREARARILADPSLAPTERDAAVVRLGEQSFTPAERRRVEALDRIDAEPASAP